MPEMQQEDESEKAASRYGAPSTNRHVKRYSTYFEDVTNTVHKRKLEHCDLPHTNKKLYTGSNMLNGYRSFDVHQRTADDGPHSTTLPVATLSNMGNTCYLNSVLYTLRFAPSFLHNLHHLVADLALMHSKINQTKAKSSSLGRTIGSITGPSSRSSSSKDLLSLGNAQNDLHPKSKMQIATEKLHELYMALHSLEMKDSSDSYQPASFLQALIEVNSIYQGHQQQDAHELLVYLLDILRETCDLLAKQAENQPDLFTELLQENSHSPNSTTSKSRTVRRSWKKHKDSLNKKIDKVSRDKQIREEVQLNHEGSQNNETDDHCPLEPSAQVDRLAKKIGFNFVSEDFGGITLRRTKCLECESVTERKEPFYDICVPVSDTEFSGTDSEFYKCACVTTENLRGPNKYWCEQCIRYNEARREVTYERLPNLLVLQLKRFSTSASGTEKVNNYIPTPLVLECFCDQCSGGAEGFSGMRPHTYQLYGVIMHVGSTMASGHYIAYTRASDHHYEYLDCSRESSKSVSFTAAEKSLSFLKFLKPKSNDSAKAPGVKIPGSKTPGFNNFMKNGAVNDVNCKSMDCCGIRLTKSMIENVVNSSSRENRENREGNRENREGRGGQNSVVDSVVVWLECDDDVVRTYSTKEFQKLLNGKRNSPATPYLLFYSKMKENSHGPNGD